MKTIVRKLKLSSYNKPEEPCMVEIDINEEDLARYLGTRAYRNKTKRAQALHRMITVRVRPCSKE